MGDDKPKVKSKRGGARKGAGRKPKMKRLTNYDKAMELLNDSLLASITVLTDGLKDKEDKKYRKECAVELLKKGLPDKIQQKIESVIEIINDDL